MDVRHSFSVTNIEIITPIDMPAAAETPEAKKAIEAITYINSVIAMINGFRLRESKEKIDFSKDLELREKFVSQYVGFSGQSRLYNSTKERLIKKIFHAK